MTKISELVFEDDGNLIIQETHDFTQTLETAKRLKSEGADALGESKLVGLVPMKMWHEWGKKWGVDPQDNEAMKEVVARELADSDNAQFRVWGGKY
jgi:hypothetical protein